MPRSAVFPRFAYDNLLLTKDAGAVTTTAADQVSGSDRILDMGSNAYHFGQAVIEVTAIDVASGTASYRISVQGSNSPTFASGVTDLGSIILGGTGVAPSGVASTVGQYMIPFATEYLGTNYRYIRTLHTLGGTVGAGINYKAFLSPQAAP